MNEVTRSIGDLERRIAVLERSRSLGAPPIMERVTAAMNAVRASSIDTGALLDGAVPVGEYVKPATGQAVFLTNEFGQFQIPTPFSRALAVVLCISADTTAFGGSIGVYDRTAKAPDGNYAPIMRCMVAGAPTGEVYVHANWIIYGA